MTFHIIHKDMHELQLEWHFIDSYRKLEYIQHGNNQQALIGCLMYTRKKSHYQPQAIASPAQHYVYAINYHKAFMDDDNTIWKPSEFR